MPLGFGLRATLSFDVGRGVRLRLQPPHRRRDRRQAIFPSTQFLGQLIATPRTQHRVVLGIDGLGLLQQLIDLGAEPDHVLGHVAIAHRLVARGIALDLGPIDGDRAQADQAGRLRQAEHLHEHIGEGVEVVLAEEADGAEVGAVGADDGQEGEVALAGQGDLSAGEDADAVGVQEQAGHQGGVEGRGAAGLVLVAGVELGEVEPGDDIEEEEDQVILRELGGGCVGLVGVGLGGPRDDRLCRQACS